MTYSVLHMLHNTLSHQLNKTLGNGTIKYKQTRARKADAVQKMLIYNPRNKMCTQLNSKFHFNTRKLFEEVPVDLAIYKV